MLLRRFRGPNGIFQMIALLESSSEERQRTLLASFASENPGLASLLKTKVLTPDRIFSWDEKSLEPLFSELALSPTEFLGGVLALIQNLPDRKALGVFVRGLEPLVSKARFNELRAVAEKTRDVAVLDGVRTQLLTKVRELERTGQLDIAAFDPPKAMTGSTSSDHAA